MLKVHPIDLSSKVGAFRFCWFSDTVWVTPCVGPDFSVFRKYLFARKRSLTRCWVLSSYWIFCNCIWRSSFAVMWMATVADFFFISTYSCVCIQLEIWILHVREHANNYMNFASGMATSLLKFLQSSLFALTDKLFPLSDCVPFAPPSSLPFPSPFEFRCGEAVGEGERSHPFAFSCSGHLNAHACPNEQPLCDQTNAVSSQGVVFGIFFAFSFRFCLCLLLLLQVCPRLYFSLLKREALILCSRCLWAKCGLLSADLKQKIQFFLLYNLQLVQVCCRDVWQWLLIILRPTLWRRLERCRSLIELSEVQDGFIVATSSDWVVNHPSNLSARRWFLLWLSFAFGCGDLFLEVSFWDLPETACNSQFSMLR